MALEHFGFTRTEARVYQILLRIGAATGYAVARELSIARANAYQAVEGLVRRGAVRRASSVPVRYSAIPPASLVAELERVFRRDLTELGEQLRKLPAAPAPLAGADGETIDTASQLVAAAIALCARATSELLLVAGPWAEGLEAAIQAALARGVTVRAVALGEPAPEGALVRPVSENELRAYWGGLPIAVVADRAAAVCGILGAEGHANGVATSSPGLVPFIRHLLRRELTGGSA